MFGRTSLYQRVATAKQAARESFRSEVLQPWFRFESYAYVFFHLPHRIAITVSVPVLPEMLPNAEVWSGKETDSERRCSRKAF